MEINWKNQPGFNGITVALMASPATELQEQEHMDNLGKVEKYITKKRKKIKASLYKKSRKDTMKYKLQPNN